MEANELRLLDFSFLILFSNEACLYNTLVDIFLQPLVQIVLEIELTDFYKEIEALWFSKVQGNE